MSKGIGIRRELPLFLLSIIGIIVILDYFVISKEIQFISSTLQNWAIIIAGFALGVGIVNLTRIHLKHILKRKQEAEVTH